MRGVYIKGAEKPDHCLRCPMRGIEDECVLQGVEVCNKYENWEQQIENCPLIPIPPHGRLIDADNKMFPTPHRNPSNDYMKGWNACLRSVQQQPTIIPAEEEKNGMS